jgi:hypothetical protein
MISWKSLLGSRTPPKSLFMSALGIPISVAIAILFSPFYNVQDAAGQLVTTPITAAVEGKAYGGAPLGALTIDAKGQEIHLIAKMNSGPELNKQFEGWLVDAGQRASGVKLSLGAFNNSNILDFQENMINPYTYSEFQVTQEPIQDKDPKAATVRGGAALPAPFGQ